MCLFNPSTLKSELDGLISKFGLLPGQRFYDDESPKAVTENMEDVIATVKNHGGICVAAHISSNNGLLAKTEGQIRIKLFKNTDLLAGEIPAGRNKLGNFEKNAVSNKLDNYKRKFSIACINSSDAKAIEEIGKRKTLIKMSSFSVEGLREAFLDWKSRVRLIDELPEEPPKFSKILAIKWDGGFLDGIGIHLNSNLNCIIGGKGTGKSTIVETLRFCFGEKPEVDKIFEQHNEIIKYSFRSGSRISVLVEIHEPSPRKYIVERTYPNAPVIKEVDGTIRTDLRPKDIFHVEVYGQKEIYEISKDRSFQLALLERFIGGELDTLKEEKKDILQKLDDNKSKLLQLKRHIESIEEETNIIPSLEEKINAYKQMGIEDKLKEKMLYSKEQQLLEQGRVQLKKFGSQLEQFDKDNDFDVSFLSQSDINELPNENLLKEAREIIGNLSKKIGHHIVEMKNYLKNALQQYEDDEGIISRWQKLNEVQDERYAEVLRSLQDRFPDADPNEMILLKNKVAQLKLKLKDKLRYDKQYNEKEEERDSSLIELQDNRSSQYRIRQKVMNALNESLKGIVKVTLEYQGEKHKFVERLKQLKSGVREDQLKCIVNRDDFSVVEFSNLIRNKDLNLAKKYGITPSSSQSLCSAISPEELYNLEVFEIPTKATLELNLGSKESSNYRNIEHLSVGQKCTVLLTLILLQNPYPLIIDQPEDDLDNNFIVSDIVSRLRCEKEFRQFIVATHNANIPVLGDAEFIVPLQATASLAKVEEEQSGSIDDAAVKNIVRETLEGGREAFEIRKEKYGT